MQPLWIPPEPVELPEALLQAVGGHSLVAATLVRRGITSPEQAQKFLFPSAYRPAPPGDLPDLERAADRLELAIQRQEKIGVWGDFDVDGQTATTLLVNALRRLGASVTYHIPVRASESHGINLAGLKKFLADGVQLILTCDTGITAHEAVEYALSCGVATLITDHHSLPPQLPPAVAVVNPQRLPSHHPLSGLCGVGTAYKLIEEIYQRMNRGEELDAELDLIALGSIADLALLTDDNRFLVQRGLEKLRHTQRLGLQVMFELAEIDAVNLSEEHVGFILAPRLNALGRLGDANPIVDFLTTSDPHFARQVALQLEGLNNQRKLLCDQVFQAAQAMIQADRSLLNSPALVLSHPQWPGGVIGIVASRLAELYQRPVVLFTTPPGEAARGSARSVEGINITQAIAANRELLLNYGGHPMAAGLSLAPEKIPEFRYSLARAIRETAADHSPAPELQLDAFIPLSEITLELVEDLDRLAPFGPGNPPPLLCSQNMVVKSFSTIGKTGEHLQLIVEDPNGIVRKVIWWQGAGFSVPEGRFDLAYRARASNFRGQRALQIEWVGAQLRQETLIDLEISEKLEVHDFRQQPESAAALQAALSESHQSWVIWQEPPAAELEGLVEEEGLTGTDRYHLLPAPILAIWSIPPGRNELLAALEMVSPRSVYLFNHNPGFDTPQAFLNRLAGLVRHALNARRGLASVKELAAATGHREETIRKGIEWLTARGHITYQLADEGYYLFSAGQNQDSAALARAESELKILLQETAAFRAYYLRADINRLLERKA